MKQIKILSVFLVVFSVMFLFAGCSAQEDVITDNGLSNNIDDSVATDTPDYEVNEVVSDDLALNDDIEIGELI